MRSAETVNVVVLGDSVPFRLTNIRKFLLDSFYTERPPRGSGGERTCRRKYHGEERQVQVGKYDVTIKLYSPDIHESPASIYGAIDQRKPDYANYADVFVLVYAVENEQSLSNLDRRWYNDVSRHCPDTPILIAGLISDDTQRSVDSRLVRSYAKTLGCHFMEAHLTEKSEVDEVFIHASRLVLKDTVHKTVLCCIGMKRRRNHYTLRKQAPSTQ